ncbi:hypothetical protein QF212_04615 [Providencia stuartii]|nr:MULTISPECIES: hypothetical protein [Providencia]MDE8745805.1 hypothetical protein [Providencia thailandensis]MDE8783650.1 hypothetical protein [Providencia thailandensis]MDE8787763.1 hypothetical protein [Providencia thailandensis]MDT7045198.1 hypothetical protein [Providencia stuartii]
MPLCLYSLLYQSTKLPIQHRSSSIEENPSIDHEGQYFIVLNNDSEYGVLHN